MVNRNSITRLGVAASIVTALVATVFVLIVLEVRRLQGDAATEEVSRRIELLGLAGLLGAMAALLLLAVYLIRWVIRPLRSVTSAAQELAGGDLSVRVREEPGAEPAALAHAFNELARTLQAEQEQTENALVALAAEKRRLETFHRAGERLAAARDLSELATIALSELALAAGAERGALWAVEPDDQRELVLEASLGVDPALLRGFLRPDETPAGRAITSLEVVAVDEPPRAELHLPLLVGGRVLGLMSLEREGAPPFSEAERDTLVRLAEQASVALSNAISFRSALRAARVNRAVLDATPDPVGLFGLDGSLLAHNAAMADVWHLPGIEATPGDGGQEERGLLSLGDREYSRYAGPVRDETGAQMGRLVVLRDVTAEREGEQLKDEFFALVSHELRTPLTSIIGYLELVRDDAEDLTPDAQRFLGVVDRNAKRLLRLVGDMLFVAQVDAGRLALERAPIDLGQVVADSVEAARPAAERGGVRLRMEVEPVGAISGDRDRIGQLVDNLVSNALKFTAAMGEVVVTLRPDGEGAAEVAVRDDGMGIPDAEQQHLFERFFRSSAAATRAVPGAGLGLTIVKTIVEAHDGGIALESAEGVGTIVRVRLPVVAGVPA
ncbi:MAG: hypothetical protein JWO90_1988 [Solirubrobacterales bacterium]|nr:hypothetical protein [Solirubrobacterales bacterium]